MFYASSWGRLFWHGALGHTRQGYRARFATFRIVAGSVWVRGVLLKEGFDSYQQVFPLPGSSIINEGSCPEVLWRSLGRLYKEGHLSQGLQPDFHPLLRQLRRVDSKFGGTFFDPDCCPFLPFLLSSRRGYVLFPCPLESTRAADFNFRQWFAGVVFPRDFFIPFMPFWWWWLLLLLSKVV